MFPYNVYPYYDWCHPAQRAGYLRPGYYYVPTYPYGVRTETIPQPSSQDDTRVDQGPNPYVLDIEEATERNTNFRNTIWTGQHLQVVLMSIPVREEIGIEIHPNVDQFLRIEDGDGLVQMGKSRDRLDIQRRVEDGDAIMVPAGTWHNVTNIGDEPLKLYTIYAPPEHPHGTVYRTKAEAMAAEQARQGS